MRRFNRGDRREEPIEGVCQGAYDSWITREALLIRQILFRLLASRNGNKCRRGVIAYLFDQLF